MPNDSHCSCGGSVAIYWRYCTAADQAAHIEEMVDRLMDTLKVGNRVWNPWSEPAVAAKFRDRLRRAAAGRLRPVDEVKPLRGGRRLFEIRWQDIAVTEVHDGQASHHTTNARLIHAEPAELGVALLGLVVHEKPQTVESKVEQDAHIDAAQNILVRAESSLWGVEPRTE